MLCFHGTTEENYKRILKGEDKLTGPWTVSDKDNCMYFWPLDKADSKEDAIQHAFEAAQVQAAIRGEDTDLYVIVCEIPDELLQDDYSCENMDSMASYILCSDFDIDMIKEHFISRYNKWYSPFIINGLLQNPHFNRYIVEDTLLLMAESVGDVYLDDMYYFDY